MIGLRSAKMSRLGGDIGRDFANVEERETSVAFRVLWNEETYISDCFLRNRKIHELRRLIHRVE